MAFARRVGQARQSENRRSNRRGAYGFVGNREEGERIDVQGACAELAFSKATGRPWAADTAHPQRFSDVDGEQIRSTTHAAGHLILHDDDADDQRFWLVIAKPPRFGVVGHIIARDGKRSVYWNERTGRPAYFVPQHALVPFGPQLPEEPPAPRWGWVWARYACQGCRAAYETGTYGEAAAEVLDPARCVACGGTFQRVGP